MQKMLLPDDEIVFHLTPRFIPRSRDALFFKFVFSDGSSIAHQPLFPRLLKPPAYIPDKGGNASFVFFPFFPASSRNRGTIKVSVRVSLALGLDIITLRAPYQFQS